jgi:hypothetical protein
MSGGVPAFSQQDTDDRRGRHTGFAVFGIFSSKCWRKGVSANGRDETRNEVANGCDGAAEPIDRRVNYLRRRRAFAPIAGLQHDAGACGAKRRITQRGRG